MQLPMPQEVINHVHILACRDSAGLTFGNQDGVADPDDDKDDDDDSTYVPDTHDDSNSDYLRWWPQ